jgi:hypothetical protein
MILKQIETSTSILTTVFQYHALYYQVILKGSTISTTLFTIFIPDLDSIILTKIVKIALYADDLCIWISSKNLNDIEKALQSAIDIITDFFQTWCIDINVQKTSYSIFSIQQDTENHTIKSTKSNF